MLATSVLTRKTWIHDKLNVGCLLFIIVKPGQRSDVAVNDLKSLFGRNPPALLKEAAVVSKRRSNVPIC